MEAKDKVDFCFYTNICSCIWLLLVLDIVVCLAKFVESTLVGFSFNLYSANFIYFLTKSSKKPLEITTR